MFDAEKEHNAKFAPDLSAKALPADEHQARELELKEQDKSKTVENWKFKTFNSIMYVPDGEWIDDYHLLTDYY